jgi:DNA-binding NarL/FixJ family response regulator
MTTLCFVRDCVTPSGLIHSLNWWARPAKGEEALELILKQKPDVAVLDVNLPQLNGFGIISALQSKKSKNAHCHSTMLKDEQAFNTALNLERERFCAQRKRRRGNSQLHHAQFANGESYVSPSLTDFLLRRRSRTEMLARKRPGLEDLTVAERRILQTHC